jgi:hypothetical protein
MLQHTSKTPESAGKKAFSGLTKAGEQAGTSRRKAGERAGARRNRSGGENPESRGEGRKTALPGRAGRGADAGNAPGYRPPQPSGGKGKTFSEQAHRA